MTEVSSQIRQLRDERGIGLIEAKRLVLREQLMRDIEDASTISDIKALLLRIVDKS